MGTTRAPARWLRSTLLTMHLLVVWFSARVLAPRFGASGRSRLVSRLAAQTLRILRVDVRVTGAAPFQAGPALYVANHVSWLDIYVLNATLGGARYIAKSEVAGWPVAGGIARGFATFFHRRGAIRDAARVKDAVARVLVAGERVVVFPEGTTSEGHGVQRFYAAFFQAAVDAGVPVQPVTLRFPGPDGRPDPAAAFVGDMTFVESVRRVLRRRRLCAELTFGAVLASQGLSRRELAAAAHGFIAATLAETRPADVSLITLSRAA